MLVAAYDDITPEKIIYNRGSGGDKPSADVYPFIGGPKDRTSDPSAFLVRYTLGTNSSAHYHSADQFQVIVEGKGLFGHHELGPYHVHFARAYTPYGPLLPSDKERWAFITLRSRPDPEGAQRLSTAREKLKQIPNRRPWQVTRKVEFPEPGGPVNLRPIEGISNDEGLRGLALTMAPGAKTTAPDPSAGDGQYVIALKGGFLHEGREQKAIAVVFTQPHEPPFQIEAGPEGLEAIILDFPRRANTADARPAHQDSGGTKTWQCVLCAFFYDEAAGIPEEGIAPGTRWEDVPDSWSCPDCGAKKTDFEMVEI